MEGNYELGKPVLGMSYEDYAAIGGLRASDLYNLKVTPAHMMAARANPRNETPALRFGKLVHSMFENFENFMDDLLIAPEFTGKTKDGRDSKQSAEAKKAKADWYADIPEGKTVVTQEELDKLLGISKRLLSMPRTMNIFKGSVRESSIVVKDPETGVLLQCRPDFITSKGHGVDIKTTSDMESFWAEIYMAYKRFYILQVAHYVHILKVSGICKTDAYMFLAIESDSPWGIKPWSLDSGDIARGEMWRAHLTKVYAECLEKNEWPCYPDRIVPAEAPENFPAPPMSGNENE